MVQNTHVSLTLSLQITSFLVSVIITNCGLTNSPLFPGEQNSHKYLLSLCKPISRKMRSPLRQNIIWMCDSLVLYVHHSNLFHFLQVDIVFLSLLNLWGILIAFVAYLFYFFFFWGGGLIFLFSQWTGLSNNVGKGKNIDCDILEEC